MTEQAVHSTGPARRRPGGETDGGGPAFLGRTRELAALRADLERAGLDTLAGRPAPRCRVLLVAGRPGTGRTALAERFAAECLATGDYPDGLLRARLTDPGGLPVPTERTARDLLAALGTAAPAGADEDELTEALRGALAGRRAVLLFDDVCSGEQLADLLPDNRGCLALAVARGPLTGVPDVRPCTVGAIEQDAALRLLVRGAGRTRVTVDPRAAERLAEACAHLPAALVLAGGWLAAHPDAALADALRRMAEPDDDGLAEITDPLGRAFRLAHSALPPPAARILRLLALAPAGVADAHTAAALAGCSLGAARTTLRDLTLLGLVHPVPAAPPAVSEEPAGPLLTLPGCLDPLLQMLLDRRERPAEVQLARARLLERTVRRLTACRAVTEPPGSPARSWLSGLPASLRFGSRAAAAEWLETRLPSLLAAARLVVAEGELDTLARRLIAALTSALSAHRGTEAAAPELYRLHELVLGVADRQRLPRERAAALLNLGDLDVAGGRLQLALDRYRSALEALRPDGDRVLPGAPVPASGLPGTELGAGRALESIAGTYAELGDWSRAADWYARALSTAQSRRDLEAEARLHGRMAGALVCDAQWPEALRAWRAAAAAHRRRGDARAQARALSEAARVQEYAGEPEESMRLCLQALRIAERSGDRRLEGALRLRLADGSERLGRLVDAAGHREKAARLLAPDGDAGPPDGGADGGAAGSAAGSAESAASSGAPVRAPDGTGGSASSTAATDSARSSRRHAYET
ncbi:ATP-binding protein [Streptomyces sp. YIM 98790]|uniref:ATP-binding protein n=1 Tax=Streptomyces sp. YIM 98790 TaxID=2689077 RepID=UPI0014076200|nr:ATP-binding protein [Streptomyces sp. YIM 98790]